MERELPTGGGGPHGMLAGPPGALEGPLDSLRRTLTLRSAV